MIRFNDVVVAVFLGGSVVLSGASKEAQSASRSRPSTMIDGTQITVLSTEHRPRIISMSSGGGVGRFTFGIHELVVTGDGEVTLDGEKKSEGPFASLAITIGTGDRIDMAVTRYGV